MNDLLFDAPFQTSTSFRFSSRDHQPQIITQPLCGTGIVAGDGAVVCDWLVAPHGQPVCPHQLSSSSPSNFAPSSSTRLAVGIQLNQPAFGLPGTSNGLFTSHLLIAYSPPRGPLSQLRYTSGLALAKLPSLKLHQSLFLSPSLLRHNQPR